VPGADNACALVGWDGMVLWQVGHGSRCHDTEWHCGTHSAGSGASKAGARPVCKHRVKLSVRSISSEAAGKAEAAVNWPPAPATV
jgi:hypothetical protein